MSEQQTPQQVDPLAQLEAAAVTLDSDAESGGQEAKKQEQEQQQKQLQEAQQTIGLVCSMVLPFLPDRYAACYGLKEQNAIVDSFGALCQARGWDVGAVLGRWGPELAFGAALVLPAVPVLMEDIKRQRAAAQKQAEPAAAAPVEKPAPVVEGNMR